MPKVSTYPSVSLPLAGTETLYGVQGGNSRKLTTGDISDLARSTSNIRLQTAIAAAAQTAIDFTGIPSWINRVTVTGRGVSTNGTSALILRIGDGAVVITGYLGAVSVTSGATVASAAETTGCLLTGTIAATTVFRFTATITRQTGNSWVIGGTGAFNAAGASFYGSDITLTGNLDRVRLTTLGGADTFDAGSVSISWE